MMNLFSFISLLILVHTTTGAKEVLPDPVLDTNGNSLLRGWTYYVVPPPIIGGGGGIVPYAILNETCSYGVSQEPYGKGFPLILTVVNFTGGVGGAIRELTDLEISFSISIGCNSLDMWKKGEYDKATKQYFVIIGGVRENPEIRILGTKFQIRKATDDFYKFVWCPSTCCIRICEDVGIFNQDGVKRLAVGGDSTPFLIKFQKYSRPELARY